MNGFDRTLRLGAALAAVILAVGCGSNGSPQSANYGNLLASPGGLVLVEGEHDAGWGRSDCFGCHDVNNMHQINRTGLPDEEVDLPGINAIIANQGEQSCMLCHGTNGVQ